MGSEIIIGFLANPLAIIVFCGLLAAISSLQYERKDLFTIAPKRLTFGYLGAFIACIAVTLVSAYISPEEALSKWQVSAENYWKVLINSYLLELVVRTYLALFGIAIIGLNITFALGRRGKATIPWVMATTVPISILAALIFSAGNTPIFEDLARLLKMMIPEHLLAAFGFSLGAGLPWQSQKAIKNAKTNE
jgi:hypothetical protein